MNRIKSSPIKLVFDILRMTPNQLRRTLFGENRFQLIEQVEVTKALLNGYSLLRWADGETALARGKTIGYQEKNSELSKLLMECLTKESENTLIGIPPANFESILNGRWSLRRLRIMFSTRVLHSKKLKTNSKIFCSTFYWYDLYSETPELISKIRGKRPCLLVTGHQEFLSACPSGTELIQTPTSDAFSMHENIESNIDSWITINSHYDQMTKPLILLACGPYSKVLVRKYSGRAQAIDVGHGFNFYLSGKPKFSWET